MVFKVELIVPVVVTTEQPPVNVTVYVYNPATEGVPLIVTTLFSHLPVTPVGKLANVAPVAETVLYVIFAIAVFTHFVCALVPVADDNVIVFFGKTVSIPVVVVTPQPPVKVTL